MCRVIALGTGEGQSLHGQGKGDVLGWPVEISAQMLEHKQGLLPGKGFIQEIIPSSLSDPEGK